jgi:soluble lytic murein transglycosylase-like protein
MNNRIFFGITGTIVGNLLFFTMVSLLTTGSSFKITTYDPDTLIQPQTATALPQENDSVSDSDPTGASCLVSSRFPEKILRWCPIITQYARKHAIQPDLIAALIWQESGGNPGAYSHSGAVGLMQIMASDGIAASFMCVNGPCFKDRPTIQQLEDPEFNVAFGTRMLGRLVRKYGNLRDALKAYGPMDVGYYYAEKVLGIYQSYKN